MIHSFVISFSCIVERALLCYHLRHPHLHNLVALNIKKSSTPGLELALISFVIFLIIFFPIITFKLFNIIINFLWFPDVIFNLAIVGFILVVRFDAVNDRILLRFMQLIIIYSSFLELVYFTKHGLASNSIMKLVN